MRASCTRFFKTTIHIHRRRAGAHTPGSQHPLIFQMRAGNRAAHIPKIPMAIITTNTSRLPVIEKCERGQTIIRMGTDNPLVPGNAAALAAFAAVQEELVAANAAVLVARAALNQMVSVRDGIEKRWDGQISQLASATQVATGGEVTAIFSAGFGVRGANVPPQPLPAPEEVNAATNGSPGRTKLTWRVQPGAVIYLVEMSPDPMTPTSWRQMATSTRASCEFGGAEPGRRSWFRVAAVNATGQGPWSAPARRGVM